MNPENINQGEKLKELLINLIPNDKDFLENIDNFVDANGELKQLIYESAINYLIRRFISSADFLKMRLDRDEDELFRKEIKKYIADNFKIKRPSVEFDKLVNLIVLSLEAKLKAKNINTAAKRNSLKKAGQKNCYICNQEVSFLQPAINSGTDMTAAEVEHIWPSSLGGISELDNLKIVCRKCNRKKGDFLDSSDYHYEHFCLTRDESDRNSFNEEKSRLKNFDIAVQHKRNFKCYHCDKPVSRVGELKLKRNKNDDSWHFLNASAVCDICIKRLYK